MNLTFYFQVLIRNEQMVDIICIHKYKWYISLDYRFVVITFLSWSLRQLLDNISNTNYKTRHCLFLIPPTHINFINRDFMSFSAGVCCRGTQTFSGKNSNQNSKWIENHKIKYVCTYIVSQVVTGSYDTLWQ